MNETNYGNFAEPKETACSKRSEEVLLTALDKIEQLEKQLNEANILLESLLPIECWQDDAAVLDYLNKWGLR